MENTTQTLPLKGIQYVTDSTGKRVAVLISLEEWGEIWEDFYDVLVSELRRDEATVSWEALKAEMADEESSHENV
jgi:hypothetical protein